MGEPRNRGICADADSPQADTAAHAGSCVVRGVFFVLCAMLIATFSGWRCADRSPGHEVKPWDWNGIWIASSKEASTFFQIAMVVEEAFQASSI